VLRPDRKDKEMSEI